MNVICSVLKCTRTPSIVINSPILRTYAIKSDLKIKWNRPEKIPCYKPEKSGDLEAFPKLKQSQFPLEYQNSKELATADELTKKRFSLAFFPNIKTVQMYIHEIVGRVKRHPYDTASMEVIIARQTGAIRAFQEVMEKFPRNKRLKVRLKELIDKRKKFLKYLRRWDYKKFEWLLENLNVVYKPPPLDCLSVARKDSMKKLTTKYCDEIKTQRLEEFRMILEAEQPAFLEEKIRSLQFIRNEQTECGVEVTVTEEQIKEVKEQLKELMEKRQKQQEN